VRSTVNLVANAQDNIGVNRVDFEWATDAAFTIPNSVSGAAMTGGTVTNGTWTKTNFDTDVMGDGTRYIRAKVTDAGGNTYTGASITVTVDNTPRY